jgi:prepilin-type N-terminal cleavage/methylation domain-containing protein
MIDTLYTQKAQQGFSLLEFIIGTALSGVVMVLLTGLLQPTLKLTELLKSRKREFYTALRIEALFREAMEKVDTHRLPIFPRVHPRGDVQYADGTPHPLNARYDSLGPDVNSDAFTWVSVHTQSLRWVSEITEVRKLQEGGYEIDLEECNSTDLPIPNEERSLLGLSPDAVFELQVLSRRIDRPCTYYTLRLTKSIILPNRVADGRILLTIRAVFSVEQIGTLYLDREDRFRLVSHSGEEIVENQPVLEDVKEIKLSFNSLADDTARLLTATLVFPSGRDRIMSFSHSLTRRSVLETLFLARLL